MVIASRGCRSASIIYNAGRNVFTTAKTRVCLVSATIAGFPAYYHDPPGRRFANHAPVHTKPLPLLGLARFCGLFLRPTPMRGDPTLLQDDFSQETSRKSCLRRLLAEFVLKTGNAVAPNWQSMARHAITHVLAPPLTSGLLDSRLFFGFAFPGNPRPRGWRATYR